MVSLSFVEIFKCKIWHTICYSHWHIVRLTDFVMKNFCLILFTLIGVYVQAQSVAYDNKIASLASITPVDVSYLECIYSHKVYDPIRDEDYEYFKILEVGNSFSKYSSYGAYWVDSIINNQYPKGITNANFTRLTTTARQTKTWSLECMIKDLKTESLKSYDKVFIDRYVYEETFPKIQWELGNETQEICGYKCNKATGHFRGRNWTAWYSEKIPIDNGPWKFGNLPGLILKIEDDDHEHIFEAISIRNSNFDFGLSQYHYIKTTREKFNKALAEFKLNPGNFVAGSPILLKNKNGKPIPNNRMFFNPIEKE